MTILISHRGLDLTPNQDAKEGSLSSFRNALTRGFGIEFDVVFTKDWVPVVWHDDSTARLTNGALVDDFSTLSFEQLKPFLISRDIPTLNQLLEIENPKNALLAFHLKSRNQTLEQFNSILKIVGDYPNSLPHLLFFDVKWEQAVELRSKFPGAAIAASVAHPFDIERYNQYVGNTLYTAKQACANDSPFDWLWLDEWDLVDADQNLKVLYDIDMFTFAKHNNKKTVVISPELHSSSPALLGGESHPDGLSIAKVIARLKAISPYGPNAICTDYPSKISKELETT